MTRDLLCEAVKARRVLRFLYEGKSRRIEPHLVGKNAEGADVFMGWCLEPVDTARREAWRTYFVERMSKLEVLEETFPHARPRFNPANDTRIHEIICSLPQIHRVI